MITSPRIAKKTEKSLSISSEFALAAPIFSACTRSHIVSMTFYTANHETCNHGQADAGLFRGLRIASRSRT